MLLKLLYIQIYGSSGGIIWYKMAIFGIKCIIASQEI
jgi:hypothetical protein